MASVELYCWSAYSKWAKNDLEKLFFDNTKKATRRWLGDSVVASYAAVLRRRLHPAIKPMPPISDQMAMEEGSGMG